MLQALNLEVTNDYRGDTASLTKVMKNEKNATAKPAKARNIQQIIIEKIVNFSYPQRNSKT